MFTENHFTASHQFRPGVLAGPSPTASGALITHYMFSGTCRFTMELSSSTSAQKRRTQQDWSIHKRRYSNFSLTRRTLTVTPGQIVWHIKKKERTSQKDQETPRMEYKSKDNRT